MRKSVVAGMLVAAMIGGAGGVASAEPARSGSSDTGSAVVDAVQAGVMLATFMGHLLACNLTGSSAYPCTPIGPIADSGSTELGSADPGSNFVLRWLLCEVGADVGSAYCPA
ncbi:hypothetical protein [Nocardia lasii]|uniref:DUF732 domain-containing protein n=1 Tax=Nocardia lasii TaxID=1616107 RepID=A0ABW1JQV3_9NOCA